MFDWLKRTLPKKNPKYAPAAVISTATLRTSYDTGKSYEYARMAGEALKIDIVQSCVEKIASTVQSIPWMARGGGVKERKDLQELLDNPDDGSGANLRYWMAANIALFGSIYVKAGIFRGQINALYPLYPELVTGITTDAYGEPEYLEYGTGAKAQSIPLKSKDAARAHGYAFRIGHKPLEFGWNYQVSPLKALGLSADIVQNLLKRSHDLSDSTPNIKHILFTEQEVTETALESLKSQIRSKQPNAIQDEARPDDNSGYFVTQGVDLKHISIDDGLNQIVNRQPVDDMDKRIARLFGIPMVLLGAGGGAEQAKYAANFAESRLSFFEDNIIPRYLRPIEEALTLNYAGKDKRSDPLRIQFDLNSIPALQDKRLSNAAIVDKITFLTENEKRQICGFDAVQSKKEKIETSIEETSPPELKLIK